MEYFYDFEIVYDHESGFGTDIDKDHDYFMNEIRKFNPDLNLDLISKGFYYCVEKHKGQFRKSNYPYYTHPLNVTLILLRELPYYDTESIIASLLHDALEDNNELKKSEIAMLFGEEIAEMVDAVTKISSENIHKELSNNNDSVEKPADGTLVNKEPVITDKTVVSKESIKSLTYRKLFMALVKDVRVMLIKIADRIHNMRTLHYMEKESKRIDIASETLNFYVPIAHRLGLMRAKMELENRSFFYKDKARYEVIRNALNTKRRDFIEYIRVFSDLIQNSLNQHNLKHTLSIVHKHEYEIDKMLTGGKTISDIDNFYSMVIILHTNDVHECYRAHGVLATAFNTIQFIDYISQSKIDWYKSLYTELYGPDGKRVELLIRNEEMEKYAEEGFAAKFSQKAGSIRTFGFTDKEIDDWGEWMQDIILELDENASQIIWDSIKVNLFDTELTIYTKEGKAVSLPQNSNLIDAAFAISEESGLHCVTAKVNGVIRDLTYKLKSGDQVEIIKSPNAYPKKEWQNEVISHRAVSSLHKYFKYNSNNVQADEIKEFDAKILIKGIDRSRMLFDITEAIGKAIIKRITLDTTDGKFEGAITIKLRNDDELNRIFTKLLSIKGVKNVEKIEEDGD